MRTRTLDVGGVRLALAEAGSGGRPLLALHGFTGAKEDFTDVLELLAALGWHAVALDQRGHGDTTGPDDPDAYSLARNAADVLAVFDALGWERAVLLGHSMGGMVAQLVAIDHPERVDALVLMDTTHGAVGIGPQAAEHGIALVREGGMGALVGELRRHGGRGTLTTPAEQRVMATRPGYAAWALRKLERCSPVMWVAMAPEVLWKQADRLDALAHLDVPTLVLVGEQDERMLADGRDFAAAMPHARLVVIPDAGHCPQHEAPEAWWAALAAFLQEVPEP